MSRFFQVVESRVMFSGNTLPPVDPPIIDPGGPIVVPVSTLHSQPIAIVEQAKKPFTAPLAKLPSNIVPKVGLLAGTINWGDGTTTSSAKFIRAFGKIEVVGSHTYAKFGKYNITITIFEKPNFPPGGPQPQFIIFLGRIQTTATVKPA